MTRALVTGATGFIGGHLVRRLLASDWEVHALVRPNSGGLPHGVHRHAVVDRGDGLARAVMDVRPDVTFHLATLFVRDHRPDQLDAMIEANLAFGIRLADALAAAGCRRLVNTGTAWQHFANAEGYRPANLYAAMKQALEDVLLYYVDAGALDVLTLVLTDTYGPGDARPKLFNLLRKASLCREQLKMTAGEQSVDLVYVDDAVEAFVVAADRLLAGRCRGSETFAVRSANRLRLRDLVQTWMRVGGRPVAITWGGVPYRPREIMEPWAGGRVLPGWSERVPLDEGLRRMEAADPG